MTPDWLTARPIAHRGLHDAADGVVENTLSSCAAAVAAGYAIEVDLQLSADGEAMVFHDDTLDRLTEATGPVAARTAAELQAVRFRATDDAMMRFSDLLTLVAGRRAAGRRAEEPVRRRPAAGAARRRDRRRAMPARWR